MKAFADLDEKQLLNLLHERDLLNRAIIKTDDKTKKNMEIAALHDSAAGKSKEEIARWKTQVSAALKKVEELDALREKAGGELSNANSKYYRLSFAGPGPVATTRLLACGSSQCDCNPSVGG